MKAADAKAPKFDSKWWEQNKAKVADADGKLKQALAAYETQIASFRRSVASGKTRKSELGVTKAKLEAVAAQAKAKASDTKLGALQKETKEALVNYEKISLQAVKDLGAVEKLPLLNGMSIQDMIIKVPQFKKFCTQDHTMENFTFVEMMLKNVPKTRQIYEEYISQKGGSQVNVIDATRVKFDNIAKAINEHPDRAPDVPASWEKAPWDKAQAEIVKLMDTDIRRRFEEWVVAAATKGVKLP